MTKVINKQIKSFKYNGEPVKIRVGTLVLTCFCVLLLIVATFTQITIKHPDLLFIINFLSGQDSTYNFTGFLKMHRYIPQVPVIFFILALLGRKFAIVAVCGYILLGMFFPVFALGGGITYLFEYGFGYILAFIPAIFLTGTLLKIKTDFLRIICMTVLGVLAIHILGVLYMLFVATLRHAPMDIIMGWIISQSSVQILYDIFFSIIFLYLGRFARRILWLIMC